MFAEFVASYEKLYEEEFGLKRMPTRPGAFFGDATRSTWQQAAFANINQNVNKRFNYGGFVGFINNAYDFFGTGPDGRLNPGPGKQFDAEVYGEYKPIDPLRVSLSTPRSTLTLPRSRPTRRS